jgi:hypothetical protein
MKSFNELKKLNDRGDMLSLGGTREGVLWLKLKSVLRKDILADFLADTGLKISARTLPRQHKELYSFLIKDLAYSEFLMDEFIEKYHWSKFFDLDEETLQSHLYKLNIFNWGGDYNNSLDRYLVSRYVKAIPSYDDLLSKFDTEINQAVRGYVLNSWYNHWSSILIEHIFTSCYGVLPAVGKIKYVDFFVHDVPFDLKVTYFPAEYLKQKRKEKGYPVELTYLKQEAKRRGITFDKKGKDGDVYYEITEKLKDKGGECLGVLKVLQEERVAILSEAVANPYELKQWLYENQGGMRFGAENRLFLVLVDKNDFGSSWKLKRNINLLRPCIESYLDSFKSKDKEELKTSFTYNGQSYTALADVLFIIKA